MILFLDNYDSFSYNIIKKIFLKNLKINSISYNIKNFFFKFIIEKIIIIGPGPNNVINSNLITILLDKFLGKKKFLGVCLGHQIICCYFNSKIYKLNIFNHAQYKSLFFYIKKYNIFLKKKIISYNSLSCNKNYILKNISNNKNEFFIFYNKKLKIKSYQFHFESIISNNNNF
ncbi:glutamine amidotransferase-related protein [Candidatus Carsonella ruddii]|uniref:Anthranilate/para-aminobenzoate synthases component II n=1 Tax=Candidatus Carsonella ruddii HC isolate Thao2000 TaxID=1202538 RepID=J3YPZ0_CARRU|nr:Anthranilate/para-aminobenzoate synthase component II [Candidatus Carsonella ruddii]AFP83898.1 Anthranilate/para-aminobenzoate synthases component II [Candidatus Carsonella ruddii HC isolate Thao2000]